MRHLFFAQKAFITHQGKLLLVRKSLEDPNQPGKWEVPGGRMDYGEQIDEHIRREVSEEVGLDIVPGPPFHIWQWQLERTGKDGTPTEIQIVAVARICKPSTFQLSAGGRVSDDYLDDMAWVSYSDILSQDLIPNMVPVVKCFLDYVSSHPEVS